MANVTWLLTIVCFVNTCNLKMAMSVRIKSDVFEWTYDLDDNMPILTTPEQISEISEAHDHMVRIDRVNGTIVLIEHVQKQQLATLHGDIAEFAEDIYQTQVKNANITAIMGNALAAAVASSEPGSSHLFAPEHVDFMNAAISAAAPYTASVSDNSSNDSEDGNSVLVPRGLRWCNWCFIDWFCHYRKCQNPAKCYFIACLESEY